MFADADLELLRLLADQTAVILESRMLLDAAAAAQARAEALRLKEDFLSSAAHDLKTPIAGILTQAQVLQRRLDRQPAKEPVVGLFDPVRSRQLIDHLVDNAVRFSRRGGEVVARVWREADEARLDVVDQGLGIPPDDMPRLFERFHRGSNVDDRRYAGLGLGLYLSRGIAEAHDGAIWAASNPARGATFSVGLPLNATSYSVRILVMSAAHDARQWADEVGSIGLVSKPFEADDLLNQVRRAMEVAA